MPTLLNCDLDIPSTHALPAVHAAETMGPADPAAAAQLEGARRRSPWVRCGWLVAGLLWVSLLTSCTITLTEQALFSPHRTRPKALGHVAAITRENFRIPAANSVTNTGYVLRHAGSRDFMLYFPGIGESADDDLGLALTLCQSNHLNVVACDYRGYGSCVGTPSMVGLLEDAAVIEDYVMARYHPAALFAYGHSLGTVPAESLGGRVGHPINGLILEAGFTNARDGIAAKGRGLPWPFGRLIKLEAAPSLVALKPQPEELITRVKCPVLFLHGTKDPCFPVQMSESLCRAAATPPAEKELCRVPGAGHFVHINKAPANAAITRFLEKYRGQPAVVE